MQEKQRGLPLPRGVGGVREKGHPNIAHRVQPGAVAQGLRHSSARGKQGGDMADYRRTERTYLHLRVGSKLPLFFVIQRKVGLFIMVVGHSDDDYMRLCCRDARNMARDVHNILLKVIMERGNMSELAAADYVKKMESQKRYSTDVWS